MQHLWCQLALSYTLLTFCAMTLLIVILYGANDYNDFHATLTLNNVEQQVVSETLTVTQALRDADRVWFNKARDTIREKLINMEHGSGTSIYRITNSSTPEVYLQLADKDERLLLFHSVDFTEKIANRFAAQKKWSTTKPRVTWLVENESIWVDMPITDSDNRMIGRLYVLYIAKFNLWVQLHSIFNFLLYMWSSVLLLSIPIGIACGLIAARYVTKQLQKMNAVTESWRQGNFEPRIELPNDDVLIRHSQHLNDMAQDLEMYMSLKQHLAVSDERNHLARELHDTVKQKLFALGLQLATVKTKPVVMAAASEPILEAEMITRETQQDLLEIITQLRPAGTGATSLYDRMVMIADDFRRRFGVRIELNHVGFTQFNAHTEHHVLRIVQESLMNAVRHGRASQVVITSKIDHDIALLTISDNGCGFDTRKKTRGFGITSIRDRVHHLPHGILNINSTAGGGTQITLSWKNAS